MSEDNSNDLLMGGGSGNPALALSNVGDSVEGVITKIGKQLQAKEPSGPRKGQPKTWPSGDPVMQVPIELKTNLRDPLVEGDDGARTWWVRQSSDAQRALRDGIVAAGASKAEVGARVKVTLTGKDESFSIAKHLHSVVYTPASAVSGSNAIMAGASQEKAAPVATGGVDVSQLSPEVQALLAQVQSGGAAA